MADLIPTPPSMKPVDLQQGNSGTALLRADSFLKSPATTSHSGAGGGPRRMSNVSIRSDQFETASSRGGGGGRRNSTASGGRMGVATPSSASTSNIRPSSRSSNQQQQGNTKDALTTTQADMHRRAQTVHYPGYQQERVHALPIQNEKRIDHLYVVDLVIAMNKENLNRFGVRKEMRSVLHSRSMQKFLLDSFWWFFLDCFSNVNFDGMVSRAQRNHLVSDAEMRAYVKSGAGESFKVEKDEAKARRIKKARAESSNDGGSASDADDEDEDDDGEALLAAALAAPKRPTSFYLNKKKDNSGESGETDGNEEDGSSPAKKGRGNSPGESGKKTKKKKQKLTIEDWAPPSHLNSLKPKNRHAEDIAQIGAPSVTSIESLYEIVRANSEASEWSDSDASTTSFLDPNTGLSVSGGGGQTPAMIPQLLPDVVSPLPSSPPGGRAPDPTLTTEGTTTEVLKLGRPAQNFVSKSTAVGPNPMGGGSVAVGTMSTIASSNNNNNKTTNFADTTCPRDRRIASSVLQVKKFLPMTYALHKLDNAARESIVVGQQHQLYTRMANNYGGSLQKLSRRLHHSLKDGLTRLLPEITSQILFVCFNKAIPYALELFDEDFQTHLWSTLSFWMGGVHRHGNIRAWPIHVLVDPVMAQKAELKAMNNAIQDAQLRQQNAGRGSVVGGGGGGAGGSSMMGASRRFSLGSGDSKPSMSQGGEIKATRSKFNLVPSCATRPSPRTARPQSQHETTRGNQLGIAQSARTQSKNSIPKTTGGGAEYQAPPALRNSNSAEGQRRQNSPPKSVTVRTTAGSPLPIPPSRPAPRNSSMKNKNIMTTSGEINPTELKEKRPQLELGGSVNNGVDTTTPGQEEGQPTVAVTNGAPVGEVDDDSTATESHTDKAGTTTGTGKGSSNNEGQRGDHHQSGGKAKSGRDGLSLAVGGKAGGAGRRKGKKGTLALAEAGANEPKFDAVGEYLAPNSRTQWMVNRDVELMKTELHRLRTTHTFSQSHYQSGGTQASNPFDKKKDATPGSPVGPSSSSPAGGGGGGTKSPGLNTVSAGKGGAGRQSAGGKGGGGQSPSSPTTGGGGGGGGGTAEDHDGIVKRTMFTYNIQAQKRTVQVIKAELDAKYKDEHPWYGSSKDRVPIKEQLGANKFSVKNWSPLVHRFMLGSGRDNGLPPEGMTWTL